MAVFAWLLRLLAVPTGVLALLLAFPVAAILTDPQLRTDIARARARAPELTARLNPDLDLTLAHYREHPYNADAEIGMWVAYEDIDPVLIEAILAREDQHFFAWWHFGVNIASYLDVAWRGVTTGYWRGGSGIEQQTAKLLFAGDARDLGRKGRELVQALWLAANFSKEQILEMYLNTAYFGNGTRGIEAAARYYFGYSFKKEGAQSVQFTPSMAASLAVTLSGPTLGNPGKESNPRRALRLLEMMHDRGQLSDAQWREAGAKVALPLQLGRGGELMPRYSLHVRDPAIRELTGLTFALPRETGVVRAALFFEAESQLYVERAVARHPELSAAGYEVSVYVVNNRTGGMEAVLSPQSTLYPASMLKPFITLCLLQHGYDRWSQVNDKPVGSPAVRNAPDRYDGLMALVSALAKSKNTVFLAALQKWGTGCVDEVLGKLGTTLRVAGNDVRAVALGTMPIGVAPLLQAYAALATCGQIASAPRYVREVRYGNASPFSFVPQRLDYDPAFRRQVDHLLGMMRDVARPGGTAKGLIWGDIPVAAKTGTAQANRQISVLSMTAYYTVLVTAHADPRRIRQPLPSTALVQLASKINADLHRTIAVELGGSEAAEPGCTVSAD